MVSHKRSSPVALFSNDDVQNRINGKSVQSDSSLHTVNPLYCI